jgi:hypothetical protein
MSIYYCAYFDHRYLAKGLAMIRSLRRHLPGAQVWVLCLSGTAKQILEDMGEPGVKTISLAELEAGDAALAAAKADGRSTVEYYFTLTPSLMRFVMRQAPDAEMVTYLDGDLWFTANPGPLYDEMGGASVLIIPHRFSEAQRHQERYGIYNVGWLTFRNDASGRACLEWWRDRNNEWCFDRVDEVHGRFCDQRYLDYFAQKFDGVHVLAHRGANLAPWNVGASTITKRGGALYADGDPVLFFHFHGLKRLGPRTFLTIQRNYGAPIGEIVRQDLYEPYLKEVLAVEDEVEARFGLLDRSSVRELFGGKGSLWQRLKTAVKIRRAVWQGYSVTAPQ